MKRLTKQAKSDLAWLEQHSLHEARKVDEAKMLRTCIDALMADIGVQCSDEREINSVRAIELVTIFRASFKSQFEPLQLIPRADLGDEQLAVLNQRITHHPHEEGSLRAWRANSGVPYLYAVGNLAGELIGVVYVFVSPVAPYDADVAWWLDDRWKGKRYSYPMLDACAAEAKKKGAKTLRQLRIEDQIDKRSRDLERYLRLHFGD